MLRTFIVVLTVGVSLVMVIRAHQDREHAIDIAKRAVLAGEKCVALLKEDQTQPPKGSTP